MKRKKILGLPIGPPEPTPMERWGRAVAVAMGTTAAAFGAVQVVRMRAGGRSRGSSRDPRSVRSEFQHRLKAGEIDLPTVLSIADEDEAIGRTRVKVLLQNLPGVGPAGARRAMDELRMQGVVVLSNIRGRALADPVYRPFFEEADRRRVCVFVHPMIPAAADAFTEYVLGPIIGFPFDTTVAIAKLCYAGVFKQLPNIRWLVAHAGGAVPYLMERMDSGWRDFAECRVNIDQPPSFYLKQLTYDTVTFSSHNLRMLRDIVGADHMAMGSDYPHLLGSIEKAVSSVADIDFSTAEKERIFSGTALSIMNNVSQTARR